MHQLARLVGIAALLACGRTFAAEAAPDCTALRGVPALICGDTELSDDEDTLTGVLADARRKAGTALPALDAEQRTWLASRDRCLSQAQPWDCVRDDTLRRTAVLQARFRLVGSRTATFACDAAGNDLLRLEFFATGALTEVATARRGNSAVQLWLGSSADGSRYVGPGVQVWLAQGQALVRWGKGADEVTCRQLP